MIVSVIGNMAVLCFAVQLEPQAPGLIISAMVSADTVALQILSFDLNDHLVIK